MMADRRLTLSSYVTDLLAAGRISFTRDEAIRALDVKPRGFLKAAERLQKKGALVNPRHGFYLVVPPQYLSRGAPPPPWYIDDLMKHEGRSYYVGLLKAAELHGATHQAVMQFQIVTDKRIPTIRVGRSMLTFFYRRDMHSVVSALLDQKTDTGRMKMSSPELTALDLLRYPHAAGTIDAIASILSDLGEKLKSELLLKLAPAFERSVIQRLGYLLEHLHHRSTAEGLHAYLQQMKPLSWIDLDPGRASVKSAKPVERNARWNVLVRHQPELDQ